MLGTTAALSGVMGVTLTMAIGGADMPGKFRINYFGCKTILFVHIYAT